MLLSLHFSWQLCSFSGAERAVCHHVWMLRARDARMHHVQRNLVSSGPSSVPTETVHRSSTRRHQQLPVRVWWTRERRRGFLLVLQPVLGQVAPASVHETAQEELRPGGSQHAPLRDRRDL